MIINVRYFNKYKYFKQNYLSKNKYSNKTAAMEYLCVAFQVIW